MCQKALCSIIQLLSCVAACCSLLRYVNIVIKNLLLLLLEPNRLKSRVKNTHRHLQHLSMSKASEVIRCFDVSRFDLSNVTLCEIIPVVTILLLYAIFVVICATTESL